MMSELYKQEQKDQFFELLEGYPNAVNNVRTALVEGRIDGSCYGIGFDTTCGCVMAAIGRVYNIHPMEISRSFEAVAEYGGISEVEELVWDIHEGDTPETNPVSALLVQWIDEHQAQVDAKGAE